MVSVYTLIMWMVSVYTLYALYTLYELCMSIEKSAIPQILKLIKCHKSAEYFESLDMESLCVSVLRAVASNSWVYGIVISVNAPTLTVTLMPGFKHNPKGHSFAFLLCNSNP